jgi:hypothetical protein
MNLSKEAVEELRIKVVYVHTTKIFADRLMAMLDREDYSFLQIHCREI